LLLFWLRVSVRGPILFLFRHALMLDIVAGLILLSGHIVILPSLHLRGGEMSAAPV
jgi:hypothetical protein